MRKTVLLVLIVMASLPVTAQHNLLEKYREMALEYNYDLKSAERNIRASLELERMAGADLKPKLIGGANYQYAGNPSELTLNLPALGDPLTFQGKNERYGGTLSLVQPLYTGGRLLETLKMAQHQQSLAKNQAQIVRSAVCYQTDIQYWTTVARAELVTIAAGFRNSMASLVQTIQERVEVGMVDSQDLLMAQVKLNEAEYQLLQTTNDFEKGRMALNSMIGIELKESTPIEIELPATIPDSALFLSGQERPEIQVAADRIKIAQSSRKINNSKYLPQLSVGAEGSFGSPGYDFKPDADLNYGIYAKLTVPVFEWGKRRSEKRLGTQKVDIAEDQLKQISDRVRLEAETARLSVNQALQRVTLAEASLKKARENEQKAFERYAEGKSSILEIIDAQVYRLTSQMTYVQAKATLQGSYSELRKSLNQYGTDRNIVSLQK